MILGDINEMVFALDAEIQAVFKVPLSKRFLMSNNG